MLATSGAPVVVINLGGAYVPDPSSLVKDRGGATFVGCIVGTFGQVGVPLSATRTFRCEAF
jgi:hypothetical protein